MAKKILIADDELDIVKMLAMRLKANDYDVIVANDGLTAMMQAHKERPDLILLDIKMPAGHGLSVGEHLKKSIDTMIIPIIFITAYANEDVYKKANEMGAEAVISKPIDMELLLSKIETALNKVEMRKAEEVKEEMPSAKMQKKILVVDDEPEIIKMLKMRLEANNYNVITATEGLDGLEKARREVPDLIILDVMLPKIDGYIICRILKFDQKFKDIPIIILTARSKRLDEQIGYETGADAYMTKPFKSEELLAKIKELLEKKGKEQSASQ